MKYYVEKEFIVKPYSLLVIFKWVVLSVVG